jgi:hypothetical protein
MRNPSSQLLLRHNSRSNDDTLLSFQKGCQPAIGHGLLKMSFHKTQDFSLGYIFPWSESILDKLEDRFFLGFAKFESAVGSFCAFLALERTFDTWWGVMPSIRANLTAQSNAAIGTNTIEKKQDLFVSRIQSVPLACGQDGTDILARQSGLLKCMLNEFWW